MVPVEANRLAESIGEGFVHSGFESSCALGGGASWSSDFASPSAAVSCEADILALRSIGLSERRSSLDRRACHHGKGWVDRKSRTSSFEGRLLGCSRGSWAIYDGRCARKRLIFHQRCLGLRKPLRMWLIARLCTGRKRDAKAVVGVACFPPCLTPSSHFHSPAFGTRAGEKRIIMPKRIRVIMAKAAVTVILVWGRIRINRQSRGWSGSWIATRRATRAAACL